MKDFFINEVKDTAEKIKALKKEGCFCFNVLTDSHIYPPYPQWLERQYNTFENLRAVNQAAKCDAVFHLGDLGWTNGTQEAISFWNQENLEKWFSVFRTELLKANQHTFFIAGNHDNLKCGEPNRAEWFKMMVEPMKDRITGVAENEPYFYVDFPQHKTRAIALMSNYREDGHKNYGIYKPQVDWLVSRALRAPDDWSILLFSHIYPKNSDIDSSVQDNTEEFAGLMWAFKNHKNFESAAFSGDFRNFSSAKIEAMFVGHGHVDWIAKPGFLPFPVVETAANHVHVPDRSNWRMPDDCSVPPREYGTVTEDLWDTVIFNPKERRIDIVRFGAGEDRKLILED